MIRTAALLALTCLLGPAARAGGPSQAEIVRKKAWALHQRGVAARDLGRLEEAAADFQVAMKLVPDESWYSMQLAEVYRLQGRFQDAADLYRRTERAFPDQADAYIQDGYFESQSGVKVGALGRLKAFLDAHPDDTVTRHHYAVLLDRAGRVDEARRQFQEVARRHRDPDERDGYFSHTLLWLAKDAREQGRVDESIRLIARARSYCTPCSAPWASVESIMTQELASTDRLPDAEKEMSAAFEQCKRSTTTAEEALAVLYEERADLDFAARVDSAAAADLQAAGAFLSRPGFSSTMQCVHAVMLGDGLAERWEKLKRWKKAEDVALLASRLSRCAPADPSAASLRKRLADIAKRRQGPGSPAKTGP